MSIGINIDKAKDIAHSYRRVARQQEFNPLDLKATIPSEQAEAEAARQLVRARYAQMQQEIDAASTIEEIKKAMPSA